MFFDAGLFVAALCHHDERYEEAWPLVEAARSGSLCACTDASVLSEVYGVLTWEKTRRRLEPREAAQDVRLLVEPPSAIEILDVGLETAVKALELAAAHGLRARRVHDARHAAAALTAGVRQVYTYDLSDWAAFEEDGLRIVGPPSVLEKLGRPS